MKNPIEVTQTCVEMVMHLARHDCMYRWRMYDPTKTCLTIPMVEPIGFNMVGAVTNWPCPACPACAARKALGIAEDASPCVRLNHYEIEQLRASFAAPDAWKGPK